MTQLSNLDNELRKEREHGIPKRMRLSKLEDRNRLPLSWHTEFWVPGEVTEEDVGFPLVPMGQSQLILDQKSTSLSRRSSGKSSRTTSKRNSFRAGICSRRRERNSVSRYGRVNLLFLGIFLELFKSLLSIQPTVFSRCSSIKRSRPTSICLSESADSEWDWVWETDEEDEEISGPEIVIEEPEVTQNLEEVKYIIAKPEEKWRRLDRTSSPGGSSRCSSIPQGTIAVQVKNERPLY